MLSPNDIIASIGSTARQTSMRSNLQPGICKVSVFAVIVLYGQLPEESPSFRTLLAAMAAAPSLRLSILLADNTPSGQQPGPLPDGVRYLPAPDNPGLAQHYNEALALAQDDGFEWLLTLDQDTNLPLDFLSRMQALAEQYGRDERVAAIVPRIYDRGRPISPLRFVGGFLPLVMPADVRGIAARHTSALNSTSLLRVYALCALGGYDPRFPLHHSDTRLYQRLDQAGKAVVVASDLHVTHELAILDRAGRMTPERYRRTLLDECVFWDLHMGVLGRTERLLRLIGRVCKGWLRHEDPVFRSIAQNEIRRRILTRRSKRVTGVRPEVLVGPHGARRI